MALSDVRRLMGRSLGFVGAHLLASAILDRATLLTLDKRRAQTAFALGVAAIA